MISLVRPLSLSKDKLDPILIQRQDFCEKIALVRDFEPNHSHIAF